MTRNDALITELESAYDAYQTIQATIDEIGPARLDELNHLYNRFDSLLSAYKESASGSGRETFEQYIAFQSELETFETSLPEDGLETGVFEDAIDFLDQRRLQESDFEEARVILEPAADTLGILTERDDARNTYTAAKRDVEQRINELTDEIEHLQELLAFEHTDFDVPVGQLRSLIEAYNQAVRDDFSSYKSNTSSREFIQFLETTTAYPLIEFPAPPSELVNYLESTEIGTEPTPRLLEYTNFTRSKLSHYVDDPSTFQARIGANQTYLDRISADPLIISWPPSAQDELHWRIRELTSVINRFAPAETVRKLNDLQKFSHRDDYPDIRLAAQADATLDEQEKQRLTTGELREELESKQRDRDQLRSALSTYSI